MTARDGCGRDELYDIVWSEPMMHAAKRFGVSGSYLARVCTMLNVPRPPQGYWAKLAVGKAQPPPPLPEAQPGDQLTWSRHMQWPTAQASASPPRTLVPPTTTCRVRIPAGTIHRMISGARHHLESGRPVDKYCHLKPHKRLLVHVNASASGVEKALGFANDLFNAFEAKGHRVVMAPPDDELWGLSVDDREAVGQPKDRWSARRLWSPQRPTVVYIGSVAIGLAIVEMSENVAVRYIDGGYIPERDYVPPRRGENRYSFTTTKDMPSGRLRLIAYSPYHSVFWTNQWQETGSASLTAKIPALVRAVEDMAPQLVTRIEDARLRAEIAHQKWLAEKEARDRAEDKKRIEQSKVNSAAQLDKVIEHWTRAMSIRRFFDAVETQLADLPESDAQTARQRLESGRALLKGQDPIEALLTWRTPGEIYTPHFDGTADE